MNIALSAASAFHEGEAILCTLLVQYSFENALAYLGIQTIEITVRFKHLHDYREKIKIDQSVIFVITDTAVV